MKDDAKIIQLWTISPRGGKPRQVTCNAMPIASAFTWSPDSRNIAHLMDGSVCITEMATGRTNRLTERHDRAASPLPQACVFSPDGASIAYMCEVAAPAGTFTQIFVVAVPAPAGLR